MKQFAYPYQSDALPLVRESFVRGRRRPCIVSPCGSGKTTVIALLVENIVGKGGRVIVRSFRRRLIEQLSQRLRLNGIDYGVGMADLPDAEWAKYNPSAHVQVTSSQTLFSRMNEHGVPVADFVIDDEKHAMLGARDMMVLNAINPKFTISLTATPINPDGTGFGPKVADDLIELCRIQDLFAASDRVPEQRLVPVETFEPVAEGRKRRKGMPSGIAGDPVRQWIDKACGMRTLVFCNTIDECNAVRAMYAADSIPAAHINADTPTEERDETFAKLQAKEILALVCTPSLMGVGVDLPFLEALQSLVKHTAPSGHWQGVGRIQRKDDGKDKAVWLNHSASNHVHGSPNVSPPWALGENDSVQRREMDRQAKSPVEFTPQTCGACGLMVVGATSCPRCATVLKSIRAADGIGTVRESLSRTHHDAADPGGFVPPLSLVNDWRKMMYSGAYQGMTCKALSARFKSKYGKYPNELGLSPVPAKDDREKKVGEWNPALLRRAGG